MHWIWRLIITVVVCFVVSFGINFARFRYLGIATLASWPLALGVRTFTTILPIGIYALLTWVAPPERTWERETRCRKCGYILRGLVEPRCSECGEQI